MYHIGKAFVLRKPFFIFNLMKILLKALPMYIRSHWLVSAVLAYMVFSVLLKMSTGFNITIPCIYTKLLGVHCPGCGLTRALMALLRLDVKGAWDWNPLIFLVLPTISYLLVWDYIRYTQRIFKNQHHGHSPILR